MSSFAFLYPFKFSLCILSFLSLLLSLSPILFFLSLSNVSLFFHSLSRAVLIESDAN